MAEGSVDAKLCCCDDMMQMQDDLMVAVCTHLGWGPCCPSKALAATACSLVGLNSPKTLAACRLAWLFSKHPISP